MIFHIDLDNKKSLPTDYVSLPTKNLLRFSISGISSPKLFTNYSIDFDKNRFIEKRYLNLKSFNLNKGNYSCEIYVELPGVYEYYIEFIHENVAKTLEKGYFLVEPDLRINDKQLSLDSIILLTVIPKWLPYLSDWQPFFDSFAKAGYNFIHFAPLCTRGSSNSPYSIKDQLEISDDLFQEKLLEKEKQRLLLDKLQNIKKTNGILCATDIVWNHTSADSLWLQDHPDSGSKKLKKDII
jgi:glycogen debranching enzyme